jgi:hypothetical protein
VKTSESRAFLLRPYRDVPLSHYSGSPNTIQMQVIRKFLGIVDRSLAARPVVINPCESLTVKVRWLIAQTTLFRFT